MNEKDFKAKIINKYGRDRKILAGILETEGNMPKPNGLVFCPFHDNFKTPAAKYYYDDNAECIWCFSENRMYHLSDYYSKLMGADLDEVFSLIWSKLSEEEKKELTDFFGDYVETETRPDDLDLYGKFKTNQLTYKQLLQELIAR